jgi:DNA mismatch endonuclease, patch repair protein
MADIWDKSKRSEVMSLIRSRGNRSTELRLLAVFRENGITGWRRGQKLTGSPDFVFRRERVCVFVDGCFWHACPKCYRLPASNRAFWEAKAERNRARDRAVTRELKRRGWRVLRIWEHELKVKNRGRLLWRIRRALDAAGIA